MKIRNGTGHKRWANYIKKKIDLKKENIDMKKWSISILIALLAIIAGCSSESSPYEEKSYNISASKVDNITIDARDRKIEILQSEDDKIHISYYENEEEFYEMKLSAGKELSMVSASKKDWKDYIGGNAAKENRTIQIAVPDASLDKLNVNTSNEDIEIRSLSFAKSVNIKNNNGDIQLDKLNVESTVTLETKNGDIAGSIVGSIDDFSVLSEAKKGDSNLPADKENGMKKLDVYTNNGDIALEFVK